MKFYVIASFFSLLLILSATTVNAKSKVFTDPIEACKRHHHGISGLFLGTTNDRCSYTPPGTTEPINGECKNRKGVHIHQNECVAEGPGASGASSSMALTGASTGMPPTDTSMMADTSGGMGGGVGGVAGAGAGAGGGYIVAKEEEEPLAGLRVNRAGRWSLFLSDNMVVLGGTVLRFLPAKITIMSWKAMEWIEPRRFEGGYAVKVTTSL
ncbi:hypothetical protein FB446DRAFT_707046 [Lentinula raphanica]|nr:hypothetical protein FB446DRAFT_707046 [Lentinula raphanica]